MRLQSTSPLQFDEWLLRAVSNSLLSSSGELGGGGGGDARRTDFLVVSLALRRSHLAPIGVAARASSFGLFNKALAKSADRDVDRWDVCGFVRNEAGEELSAQHSSFLLVEKHASASATMSRCS